jgi:hypothetical protein
MGSMQITASGIHMERIATDILFELPETDRGNRHVLIVSDYFTKWTEAFALPNMVAETIARTIMEQIIARFGVFFCYLFRPRAVVREQRILEMCR